jgi:hypothetical protein
LSIGTAIDADKIDAIETMCALDPFDMATADMSSDPNPEGSESEDDDGQSFD